MNNYTIDQKYWNISEQSFPYIFIAFLVYMAGHGIGLINAGLNVDDWAMVGRSPAWGGLGRWAQELYFKYILLANFSDSFQIIVAFVIFAILSYLISKQIEGNRSYLLFVAIFSLGISHPYWVDALNFSGQLTSGPLAVLLSLLAFQFALLWERSALYNVAFVVCGAALLCISFAIYQPYAFSGLIVPCISMLSVDSINRKRLLRILAMSVMILSLGSILYIASYNMYFEIFPSPPDARSGSASLALFVKKLYTFPWLFMGTVTARGFHASLFSALHLTLIALAALLILANILNLLGKKRYCDSIRVVAGSLGALIAPTFLGWFVIKAGYPPRALATFSFGLGALIFTLRLDAFAPVYRRFGIRNPTPLAILFGTAAFTALAGLIVCSGAWFKQHLVYERDKALAISIVSVYVSLAKPKDRLVLVGWRRYGDLYSTASVGNSAFGPRWSRRKIFKGLFGNRTLNISILEVNEFDHTCSKYPQPGSVIRANGAVYVCILANIGGVGLLP